MVTLAKILSGRKLLSRLTVKSDALLMGDRWYEICGWWKIAALWQRQRAHRKWLSNTPFRRAFDEVASEPQ